MKLRDPQGLFARLTGPIPFSRFFFYFVRLGRDGDFVQASVEGFSLDTAYDDVFPEYLA